MSLKLYYLFYCHLFLSILKFFIKYDVSVLETFIKYLLINLNAIFSIRIYLYDHSKMSDSEFLYSKKVYTFGLFIGHIYDRI